MLVSLLSFFREGEILPLISRNLFADFLILFLHIPNEAMEVPTKEIFSFSNLPSAILFPRSSNQPPPMPVFSHPVNIA